ncbi:MAG: hypothetical protein S4CHLAM37_00640 [Chlamydiia bacterium]|nr:hypothetical protein [Chlamydiia bacterium]
MKKHFLYFFVFLSVSLFSSHQEKMLSQVAEVQINKDWLLDEGFKQNQANINELIKTFSSLYKIPYPKIANYNGDVPRGRRFRQMSQKSYDRYLARISRKEYFVRDIHGLLHATRATFFSQVFIRIYEKYLGESVSNKPLLGIAAFFHDTGRERGGTDYWDSESGALFEHFLELNHKSQEEVKLYGLALKEKDPKGEVITDWKEFLSNENRIVHDADSLDIIRCKPKIFDINYLACASSLDKGVLDVLEKEARIFIEHTKKKNYQTFIEFESREPYFDLLRTFYSLHKEKSCFPFLYEIMKEAI